MKFKELKFSAKIKACEDYRSGAHYDIDVDETYSLLMQNNQDEYDSEGNFKGDKNNNIIIQDWTGRILFQGDYQDKEVDRVLDANRCSTCVDSPVCKECEGTGYAGDFSVQWEDQTRSENVYEFINY